MSLFTQIRRTFILTKGTHSFLFLYLFFTQWLYSPETVLILRALTNFESVYLSRSIAKLNESVGQAFSGGTRTPPGMNEGIQVARTIANELDSARFDPLLVKAAARGVVSSIDMMLSRLENIVSKQSSWRTMWFNLVYFQGLTRPLCCHSCGSNGNTPASNQWVPCHLLIPFLEPVVPTQRGTPRRGFQYHQA